MPTKNIFNIYGVYKIYGATYSGFYTWEEWHTATFCPDTEELLIIDLHTHGKTYAERKSNLRDKAIDFQSLFTTYDVSLSWDDLMIFGDFFAKYGKRYGLLSEFHENGIC